MKKTICILLSLLSLLALVACENPSNEPSTALYFFEVNGIKIEIDAQADTILSALGEPKAYDESPSCAFDGLDKVYVFASFKIQTYPLNGKDYIRSVSITDDAVATREGVTVGASRDEVIAAYGTPSTETSDQLTYLDKQNTMHLQFLLRDGKVTNIYYAKQIDTQ